MCLTHPLPPPPHFSGFAFVLQYLLLQAMLFIVGNGMVQVVKSLPPPLVWVHQATGASLGLCSLSPDSIFRSGEEHYVHNIMAFFLHPEQLGLDNGASVWWLGCRPRHVTVIGCHSSMFVPLALLPLRIITNVLYFIFSHKYNQEMRNYVNLPRLSSGKLIYEMVYWGRSEMHIFILYAHIHTLCTTSERIYGALQTVCYGT